MVDKPKRAGRVRILTKKREPEEGLCILVENGVPCVRRRIRRGLCSAHIAHLRTTGRFEDYALPRRVYRRRTLEVKTDPEPGLCRVVDDGVPCEAPGLRRGLCLRHYGFARE